MTQTPNIPAGWSQQAPGWSPQAPGRQSDADPAPDALQPAPPTLWEVVIKWMWRGTLGAFFISLLVHLTGLLLAGLVIVGNSGAGASGTPAGGAPKGVDFAVMTDGELAELQAAGLVAETPAIPETMQDPSAEAALDAAIPGGPASGELTNLGSAGAGGDIAGGDGLGLGGLGGSGGGGGASFFGVEAQGSRFAYIVDVSGSMSVGGKMDALKSALLASVSSLVENSSFFICPFSTGADPLAGKRDWTEANDRGKKWARQHVFRLAPNGSTNPGPAFQIVMAMRPRPDAVYFLTDGEFDPQVADDIKVLNSELHIPIHTMCLETKDSEAIMKRIAAESKGTYTFIASGGVVPGGGPP